MYLLGASMTNPLSCRILNHQSPASWFQTSSRHKISRLHHRASPATARAVAQNPCQALPSRFHPSLAPALACLYHRGLLHRLHIQIMCIYLEIMAMEATMQRPALQDFKSFPRTPIKLYALTKQNRLYQNPKLQIHAPLEWADLQSLKP